MNNSGQSYKIAIGAVALGAVIIIVLITIFLAQLGSKEEKPPQHSTDSTTINSPVTKSSDNLTVSYGGNAEPNMYAAQQPFRLFGKDQLPLPSDVKEQLEPLLIDNLRRQVVPTYATTFVHIEKSSIHCPDPDSCSMAVYIDSPELYFDFKVTGLSSVPSGTLTPKPWKGIRS